MSKPLLCVDCRHAGQDDMKSWICAHPTSRWHPPPDLVTGASREGYQLPCRDVRSGMDPDRCGPAGKFWEARAHG